MSIPVLLEGCYHAEKLLLVGLSHGPGIEMDQAGAYWMIDVHYLYVDQTRTVCLACEAVGLFDEM